MTLSLSRRTFLRRSAAASAFSVAPWFLKPDLALAQDEAGSGIAAFIGKGLASGVLGNIGSMAFGHIMESMGIDLSGQAAMSKKLDQILAKLDNLQKSVDSMMSYLRSQLSQMSYDQSYSAVGKLVATNKTVYSIFRTLLQLDAKAHPFQALDLKRKILALVNDPDYQIGVQTWHDSLVGENGQSSLLRTWGSAIFNQDGLSIFDSSQAQKIQARWDSFDAQQAMTVWCLVEGYNGGLVPQPELANSTLETWWANRKDQLRVLRGCVKTVDQFTEVVNGKSAVVTTKLNCMPPYTLYSKATQKLWMLIPWGPIHADMNYVDFQDAARVWLQSPANKTGVNYWAWQPASDDEFVKLGLECGGLLGPGHDIDIFAEELKNHGFLIPDTASFKVAASCHSDVTAMPRVLCDIFVQRDNWDRNGPGPAYVLFNRVVVQSDNFFYT